MPAALPLVVPFWLWVGALVVLVGAAGVAYRWRLRMIVRRAAELESLVAKRTTELATANAEVRAANREIRRFVYLISHDLRGPVLSIQGFVNELQESCVEIRDSVLPLLDILPADRARNLRTSLCEEVPEALEFIATSAHSMGKMTRTILQLARLGQHTLELERLDVNVVVNDVLAALSPQIKHSGAQVLVQPLPSVVADRASLERIFTNLLSNAIKYLDGSRPGEVRISAEQGDLETVFYVGDNGQGIADDDISKVFEPFRRLGSADTSGEGVGLFYVQALVRRHHGRIECRSREGDGSTFSFTIPNPSILMAAGDPEDTV